MTWLQGKIESWDGEGLSKREFLSRIDALRDPLFEQLSSSYGDTYYAKLLYLKTTNYILARHHYRQGHVQIASQPFSLMVDPSSSCQLQCPGCVHSDNTAFTANISWPPGVLKLESFEELLRGHGPFATNSVLYNYGEPLLNKKLPDFILAARGYGMSTHLSTNFSLRFDVERFMRSAPDHVIISIDGITQETYGRYRKRGDLALALANLRQAVEWKRKLSLTRPILTWRFFPFAHNVHEVDQVLEMAREIGVDEVIIGTPFGVSNDDPGIQLTECEQSGRYDLVPTEKLSRSKESILAGLVRHDEVERLFDDGWSSRLTGQALDESAHPSADSCKWLYVNVTVDGSERVMPCCKAPGVEKNLVYGQLDESHTNWLESEVFEASRQALIDPAAFARELTGNAPYCSTCPKRPPLTYGPATAITDLASLDFERVAVDLDGPFWWGLSTWDNA